MAPAVASREADPQGRELYLQYCAVCHGPEGRGMPGLWPPLAGSDWARAASPESLIRYVLNGLQGPITVNGQSYQGVAPAWRDVLNDQQVAAVLTFIRSNPEWGNAALPVTAAPVKAIREATASRGAPWTAAELPGVPKPGAKGNFGTADGPGRATPPGTPRAEADDYE